MKKENKKSTFQDAYLPKTNFLPEETDFVFEVAMPGFKRTDLEVSLEGDVLTIKGDRGKCHNPIPTNLQSKLTGFDCFEMKFHLAEDLCREKIYAEFNAPLLSITFKRVEDEHAGEDRIIEII